MDRFHRKFLFRVNFWVNMFKYFTECGYDLSFQIIIPLRTSITIGRKKTSPNKYNYYWKKKIYWAEDLDYNGLQNLHYDVDKWSFA